MDAMDAPVDFLDDDEELYGADDSVATANNTQQEHDTVQIKHEHEMVHITQEHKTVDVSKGHEFVDIKKEHEAMADVLGHDLPMDQNLVVSPTASSVIIPGLSSTFGVSSVQDSQALNGHRDGGLQGHSDIKMEPNPDQIQEAEEFPIENAAQGRVFTSGNSLARPTQTGMDREFLDAAQANKGKTEAEWQYDSSDMDTSTSDSNSDSSSDDSDADGDYEMLDPATAAKMLMAEEGGEDEDGPSAKSGNKSSLRTKNEVEAQVVPKPDVTITDTMKVVPLGNVESIVENLILIKGYTTGEYQVLEQGSVLCLEDRTVIGAVSDTLGPVQAPLYCVAFTNREAIDELSLQYGVTIFYVEEHSTFVFTKPLQELKGTDASNIHDEEIGDDEVEFSDDEAERAHKQAIKQAKINRKVGTRDTDHVPNEFHGMSSERRIISYDDDDEESPQPNSHPVLQQTQHAQQRGSSDRGRGRGGRDRGRGRGRGHFGRDDRGRGSHHSGARGNLRGPVANHYHSPAVSTQAAASAGLYMAPAASSLPPQQPAFPAFNMTQNAGSPQYGNLGWQASGQYAPLQPQQTPTPAAWQPPPPPQYQVNQHQPLATNTPVPPPPFPTGAYANSTYWNQQAQPGQPTPGWPAQGQQNQTSDAAYQAMLQHVEMLRRMNGGQQ
ncbi:hypothetical protein ANO11243_000260 [Dothideomycetidae sp. 11243]|nr:hypothetical protein ANO11243_000260 [fungal sp. No.11243]